MRLSDCIVEAAMAVSDLDRAKRFYEGQLGLVPRDEAEQSVRYPCAQGTRIFV
jgi:catechol 2,3-dioxygenase-like lactoylglutathione lyase family enzyme